MEQIVGITFICIYAVLDGLGDAFIFRNFNPKNFSLDNEYRRSPTFKEIHELSMLGFYEKYDYNTNWHRAQAAQQSAVILATAYLTGSWPLIVLGAGAFWLVHDGIVNRIGLDRPFFFVGTTAWIDRQFQKTGHPELFMGIAKIVAIVTGCVLFFI